MNLPRTTVLFLEDSDLDAELIRDRLGRSGLGLVIERAVDRDEFVERLTSTRYDLILSDYQVPGFDGLAALALAREHQPDTPFIFVSGMMGEELAVETLKRGATDYILKQRLARLPAAVERALADARLRSERKRVEAERERAERETATTLESIAEAFVAVDRGWRFTYVNAQAERAYGVRRENLLGRGFWDVFPEALGTVFEREYRRAMTDRVTVQLESPFDRLAGWFVVNVFPVEGGGLSFYFQDITERKRAEERLQESEQRFRLMANAVPVLIWVSDITKGCIWFNQWWLDFTARPMQELVGDGWAEDVHPDDFDRCLQVYTTHFDARRPFEMEYRLKRHDGEYRWVLDNGIPRFDIEGVFAGYIGSCVDFTERKQAEEALRAANRRKDEFLATLAHELRNPLAPIRNGLALLQMDSAGPSAPKAIAMMERQLAHMVHLLDDLLDIARVNRGTLELRRQRVQLKTVIEHAVETSRPVIDAGRHTLTVSLPDEPVWLDADLTRLAQVMGNVLINAAKYTPEGGAIALVARREEGEAIVAVTDTGVGIAPDMLGEVFEMFAQVSKSLDRSQGGLGIGLALVKYLVGMHGGTIVAESPGPGRGSTFTVRLPAAAHVAANPTPDVDAAVFATPVNSRRVLIVDDNQDGAESLAMLLELAGHEIRTAYSGSDALAAAHAFLPEVVFLDIGLPDMNGHEVARQFRADPTLERAVLVALTGSGSGDDKRKSKEVGFDFHLTKPAEPIAVAAILVQPLRRGR